MKKDLKPWLVLIAPARNPRTLSWSAELIDENGHCTYPMAYVPVIEKPIYAVSKASAITKMKTLISNKAKEAGQTLGDWCYRQNRG